jgi:hypothetical protein
MELEIMNQVSLARLTIIAALVLSRKSKKDFPLARGRLA